MAVANTHYGASQIEQWMDRARAAFFIGIGGVSMSSLAILTARRGYTVLGSDRTRSRTTERLEAEGIRVLIGHDATHLEGADVVVYTVAIGEDNPEYRAALANGIPCISRADYLGWLMTDHQTRIGISGMHGKSTCTAMCASILAYGADATVLCGAPLTPGGATYRIGADKAYFLFEACEYMDSFLDFYPTLAVVLNIGLDHVDYFRDMEQIRASFRAFAERTGKDGRLLYCFDDAESKQAFFDYTGAAFTFSTRTAKADFYACGIVHSRAGCSFELVQNGIPLGHLSAPVHGGHGALNMLAAASAMLLAGCSFETVRQGLASFRGLGRRMEYKGTLNGAMLYDDYAHHPDEIRATLAGAKEMGYERILCAFQPHTYSRTAGLFDEFADAFGDADRVLLADIYAARETNRFGVSSQALAARVGDKAAYCPTLEALAETLKREAHEGDLVILMGAGDIDKVFSLL